MAIYLSVPEASSLSGISRFVLWEKIRSNKLAAWRPSVHGTRINLVDLAPLLPPDVRALLPTDLNGETARGAIAGILAGLPSAAAAAPATAATAAPAP